MNNITRMTALALAVGGFGLAGCEGEAEVETTDAGRQVDRATDDLARDVDRGTDQLGRDMDKAGDDLARQTDRFTDDAREAGAELRDDAGEAARAAGRETRDVGRELGDATDRTVDRVDDATRDATAGLQTGVEGTQAAPDAEGIRDTVASATEAALSEDGFDDMVERFVDADRNRLGDFIDNRENFDDLNQKAQAVRDLYQQKFDAEFDIEDEASVYSDRFATIRQGEIGQARQAAGADDPDANRDEGRNVAGVMIAESHGLPQLTVNMIHEMPDSWKIDIPDAVTGQQLYTNLSKALDDLANNKDKWPQEQADAQRYITHNLMMAIHGDRSANGQSGTN